MGAAFLRAYWRLRKLLKLYTVALQLIGNIWKNSFRRFNFGIAAIGIPLLQLGDPATIERGCKARVEPQRYVVVGDGIFQVAHF